MTFVQAHSSNFTKGRTRPIDRVIMHYTAGNGDTAENNGKYFAGADRKASAHYFVDENSIVQTVAEGDTAWHAGNWDMNCRSVGIELCSRKDSKGVYYIPDATVQRAAALVRELMEKYSIPVSGVIRHYDVTGKRCPEPMVENEVLWSNFKAMLTLEETPKGEVHPAVPAPWAADAWEKAKTKGIMDGTRPRDPVTRQELAVVLERLGQIE